MARTHGAGPGSRRSLLRVLLGNSGLSTDLRQDQARTAGHPDVSELLLVCADHPGVDRLEQR
jgi:hypothetical protein